MKTIGVIGAMEEETALLKERFGAKTEKTVCGMEFFKGKTGEKDIILVTSGIGKVNAAVCAQILADLFGADAIINVGVAGGVNDRIAIGDIVISDDALEHDIDASPCGDPKGVIPNMKESVFKADEKLKAIALKAAADVVGEEHTFTGRIVSGDQFIADVNAKKELAETFNADCAEMEGAAIAHACYLNGIPFVIVRSISDNINGNNGISYARFKPIAAKNSSDVVIKFLQNI